MSGIYYTDLLDVLRAAGCQVAENGTTNGWQSRSRSSGGFPAAPLCVFWHHTASQTSPQNDLNYMIIGCDDEPVGNMLIDRDGVCWPIAAGASNCAGKGGPSSFSRGTIPKDQGNVYGWQIEVANNGIGEAWPIAQVNACFQASNAMNARFGNQPTDIITHALGAGDGYTDRKIDPATADAVQGSWRPRSANSSGTWVLADIRAECAARAGAPAPEPTPPPEPGPTPEPTPPPSGWTCPPFPGTGDYGCSFDTCRAWQDAMILNGYIADNSANHDGVWGNGMHNACASMQTSWGWGDADGVGGKHTWPHLRSRDVAPCPTCGG